MSRITPEAPRRLPVPRSSISPQREGLDISMRGTWASSGGWDFWAARVFLVACTGAVSYTLGPFGLRGVAAAGGGFLIGLVVLLAELGLRRGGGGGCVGGGVWGGGCA